MLERVLSLIAARPSLRLCGYELKSHCASGLREYSIDYNFSAFGEALESWPATRDEILEYLVWVILFDACRSRELEAFVLSDPVAEDSPPSAPISLAGIIRQEDAELVNRVEKVPDLLNPAAGVIVRLLKRGDRLGCGNRESYENLYYQDGIFHCEAGDPIADGPTQDLKIDSEPNWMEFLKRYGWVTFEKGVIGARGDLGWKLRHFLREEEKVGSLRLYLERLE